MELKEYLLLIVKSLNPNKHRDMVNLSFFNVKKYFFFLFGLCLLLSLALLIPKMSGYQNSLGGQLQNFNDFNISADASLDESIEVLKRPKIVVDFDKANMTDEFILVNDEKFMYKPYIFFGEEEAVFSEYQSVKSDKMVSLLSKAVIFVLPALLFWIAMFFLIKYFVLILLVSVIGWIFFISGRHELKFRKSLKTAIFTATPMVILDVILWPLFLWYIIPVAIYVLYYIMGVIMVSDRKYQHKG